jgi:shikimate kinase
MEDKKLLFVCGFMSAGKTTHGKKLARNIGYHFIDLDQYTEKKYDKSITELFAEVGEDEFRNIETISLNECINDNQKTVIALGGGTPCYNNNIELLKKSGQLIYLKMDAEALLKRVFGIKANRPLLANQEEKDMLPYIEELLQKRAPFYEQSNLTVYHNNLHEDEFKETVLNFIKK